MRLNISIISLIVFMQTALYSLKYAPVEIFKALYNIGAYDKVNMLTWVIVAVLLRRLAGAAHLNAPAAYRRQAKYFRTLSCMMVYLTVGGFVNEMSGHADDPKFYLENIIWAILVFLYYFAVITIYCVKIYRLGRV